MNSASCSCRGEPSTWQIVDTCLLSLELSNEHLQTPGGTGGCRASLESRKDMCHLQRALVLFVVVTQPRPTLCDPVDCSWPGSSVHGILQARILEWVAVPSSRRSSRPRDQTCISCIGRQNFFLPFSLQGKPPGPWPTSNPFYRVPSVGTMLAHLHCKPP